MDHDPSPLTTIVSSDLKFPIALHKDKRSTTMHHISHLVSYNRLNPSACWCALSLSIVSVTKYYQETLMHPSWKQALDEIDVLLLRQTWDLAIVSPGLDVVGCHWVFKVEYCLYWTVDREKARLVAKGSTQTYDIDYFETSPIARLNSIHVIFSILVNQQ